MKRISKSRQFAALALTLIMALSFAGAVLVNAQRDPLISNPSNLTDVTGEWNLADLTSQYDSKKVSENRFDPDGEYWVFVRLKRDPVADEYLRSKSALTLSGYAESKAGLRTKAKIEKEQKQVLERIRRAGIRCTTKYSYSLLDNALAVKVKYRDIKAIRGVSGVESVTLSERYAAPLGVTSNDANVYSTGIYNTEGIDYTGSGMLVAVLDTGLDQSHQAFQVMPEGSGITTKEDVKKAVFDGDTSRGLLSVDDRTTVEDVYYNAKVPFAYDYADKDPVVYPSYSSHGTHVAGIIAGAPTEDYITDQDGNYILDKSGNPMKFKGVAPDAQLAICKVFTDNEDAEALGGAETVDILAALEDCVKLNVDIINMSLGSSAGFTTGEDEHMIAVYDSVKAAGISLVVAASNDYSSGYGGPTGTNLTSNPDASTVGAPSTFDAALSVASINGQLSPYVIGNKGTGKEAYAYFTEASDGNGNPKKFVEELLAVPSVAAQKAEDGSVTLDYVVVPGYGQAHSYTSNINVKGKIALVQRGGNVTFEEKEMTAKRMGAVGCIIYNNVSGIIRMSLGNDTSAIPTCSITMDAAKGIVDAAVNRTGKITIAADQKAGPFMSDFSSWGPNPDLKLKPEISAHGGEITSAVPGGWDEYSGTSMAAPNMAGVMSLILEHVRTDAAFSNLTPLEQIAVANRLVMSTATIARNEYGDPYSPRKQGAGLADVRSVIDTKGYIYTKDRAGAVMDKTKIELGDDPDKTGVYELKFTVKNITNAQLSYNVDVDAMTETLASDNRTVAERAYMLNGMSSVLVSGKGVTGTTVTVPAGGESEVTVKVTLSGEAKDYLNKNFANGMYVEGFVKLSGNDGSLNVPWLAFYGDWYAAPMFDISDFELSKALQDASIPEEDKPEAAIFATLPVGMYNNDKYIIPLGTYLYVMPEGMDTIYSSTEKAAISCFDEKNHRTVYELYGIYAGLLRGCKTVEVVITDAKTGETVFTKVETNVRKAYTAGSSSARPGIVKLEMNTKEWNLVNNKQYHFYMKGTMDRVLQDENRVPEPKDGMNYVNTYEFDFSVDTEAPEILDYRVRYQPYEENYETKYKVYLDVDVSDNAYAQSLALCYGNMKTRTLELLTGELIPIYQNGRGTKTTVTVDITDYYDSKEDLYIQVDDYALNARAYRVSDFKPLGEAASFPEEIEITDGTEVAGENYREISIMRNEALKLNLSVSPANAAVTNLHWTSSNSQVVKVQNGEVFGVKPGYSYVTVYAGADGSAKVKSILKVNVTDQLKTDQIKIRKIKFQMIEDKDKSVLDPNNVSVNVHPGTTYTMRIDTEPWYFTGTPRVRWESSNPAVASVSDTGVVKTLSEGVASITATLLDDAGNPTIYTANTSLAVGPEFVMQSGYLREYHGAREKVTIPKSLNVYYIYEEAFMNNDTVVELEISSPCTEIQPYAFANMKALKRVILPETVTFVSKYAFYNCTALETVDIRSQSVTFGKSAFEGCTSLKNVNSLELKAGIDKDTVNILELADSDFTRVAPRMTTLGDGAFYGCTALQSVDLTQLRVCGDFAFRGCGSLVEIALSKFTAIGREMFYECSKLAKLVYTDTGKLSFENLQLPFDGTQVVEIQFADGGEYTVEKQQTEKGPVTLLYEDAAKTKLCWVSQNAVKFTVPASVKEIAGNALAGNLNLKEIDFTGSAVERIGDFALAGTGLESVVLPASVTSLGKGVLSYNYELKSAIVESNVSVLPEMMFFENLMMTSAEFPDSVTEIGDRCFYHTRLGSVDWSNKSVTKLGDEVLGQCIVLQSVKLPRLTEIGNRTFYLYAEIGYDGLMSYGKLEEVSFAEGATAIGTETFAAPFARTSLERVTLPNSLKSISVLPRGVFANCAALTELGFTSLTKIGDFALAGCSALASLNTAEVTQLGNYALYNCASLTGLNLLKLTEAGDYALARTEKLREFIAPSIASLGNGALSYSGITKAELGNIAKIGEYAFASSACTGIFYVPASLVSVGRAAFTGMKSVTGYRLTAPSDFLFVDGGVLYSKVANGYQLEAYPGAKSATGGYEVLSGTVRIGESAFENAVRTTKVLLPYELAAIGDKAFYASSVRDYVFRSLNAPNLETSVISGEDYAVDSDEYLLFGKDTLAEDKFYANFVNYVAFVKHASVTGIADLGLTVSYPSNAYGYDARVWELFFSTVIKTEIIADDNTNAAQAALEAMPKKEDILALKSASDREAAKALLATYKALVKAARSAYSKVTDAAQQAFLTPALVEALPACEAAVREVRAAFGEDVRVTELKVETKPAKTEYEHGERFDPAGLVLTAIFDDGSTISVTEGYTYSQEPLQAGAQNTPVVYEGVTAYVNITVRSAGATPGPEPSDEPQPAGCGCGSVVTGGGTGGLLAVGAMFAAALAVLLLVRKRNVRS